MGDPAESSPLVPPPPITDIHNIDLEAGPGEQIQCRICLETDGNFTFLLHISLFFLHFLGKRDTFVVNCLYCPLILACCFSYLKFR